MSDLPQGYQDIPEEDRKKAQAFFDKGKGVADAGQYDYAIDMYLQGDQQGPGEHRRAQGAARDLDAAQGVGRQKTGHAWSIKLGRSRQGRQGNLINAEKLLCYDPGNVGQHGVGGAGGVQRWVL
jgi:hypothetical protein